MNLYEINTEELLRLLMVDALHQNHHRFEYRVLRSTYLLEIVRRIERRPNNETLVEIVAFLGVKKKVEQRSDALNAWTLLIKKILKNYDRFDDSEPCRAFEEAFEKLANLLHEKTK